MSLMDLHFLGLSREEITALKEAVRAQHSKGGMQTSSCCSCGHSSGGPTGTLACRALGRIIEAGKEARLERPPRRDPSICNHNYKGTLRVWEYQGDMLCEICSTKL